MRPQLLQQAPPPGTIRTKKTQLTAERYTEIALRRLWKKQWWLLVALAGFGVALALVWPSWWVIAIVALLALLHVLFWGVQVTGVTKLDQTKILFERVFYEINAQNFLLKKNDREGAQLKWEMFDRADRLPDAFILTFTSTPPPGAPPATRLQKTLSWLGASELQFMVLPFDIFIKPADLKLMESTLKRKNLLPAEVAPVAT
jgi:hypothetical protein